MPDNDPFFDSTYMTEATCRVDMIHNEFIARVKASAMSILDVDVDTPPGSPSDLDAYLIGSSPTGAWSAAPGKIAVYLNGWKFITPKPGMRVQVVNDSNTSGTGRILDYCSSGWSSLGGSFTQSAVNESGTWTVDWDTKYGSTMVVQLTHATTVFKRPSNLRPGRTYTLVVKQDATGGRLIQLRTGDWLVPGGSYTQPSSGANKQSVYLFTWPGTSYAGPILLASPALDIQVV